MNAQHNATPNSAAFLRRQQAEARAALHATATDLKRDLLHAIDPQTWIQISPWATLGVAAASGFAAAAVVVPGRHSPVTAPPNSPEAIPASSNAAPPASGKASGAIWAAVSTGLYGLARVALSEVISSAMRMDPVRESAETAYETADVDSDVFV